MIDESGNGAGFDVAGMTALEEIKKALEGVTPGPWKWFGNASSNHVYLATTHSGRRYVMDFVRWGMRGAQPRFQPAKGGMIDAKDLLQFEVGDRDIVGMEAAKKDGSVYRYDVRGIDCPDARYIAAVNPAVITELIYTLESLQRENEELRKDKDHIEAEKAGIAKIALNNVDYWKSQAEAAEAEVKHLQAEIDRKSSMSGDHRYWEGRYRDEAAENEKLRELLTPFAKFDLSELKQRAFLQILVCPEGDDHADNYGPHFHRARQALASTGGEHNADK